MLIEQYVEAPVTGNYPGSTRRQDIYGVLEDFLFTDSINMQLYNKKIVNNLRVRIVRSTSNRLRVGKLLYYWRRNAEHKEILLLLDNGNGYRHSRNWIYYMSYLRARVVRRLLDKYYVSVGTDALVESYQRNRDSVLNADNRGGVQIPFNQFIRQGGISGLLQNTL